MCRKRGPLTVEVCVPELRAVRGTHHLTDGSTLGNRSRTCGGHGRLNTTVELRRTNGAESQNSSPDKV